MAQPLYSIPLLNDLHQWFPDILYNPGRFQTVQDLLEYIQQVANVSPYTRGLQQYAARQNQQGQHYHRQSSHSHQPYAPPPATGSRRFSPYGSAGPAGIARSDTVHRTVPFAFNNLTENTANPSTTASASTSTASSVVERRSSPVPNRTVSETTYEYTATTNVNGNPITARVRSMPISTAILELEEGDSYGDSMSSLLQQLLAPNILRNFFEQNVEVAPTQTQLESASTLFTAEQNEDDNCAICQDSMEEGQQLRRLNHCRHTFHKSCVDTWFRTNVHCPSCRHDIREHASQPPPPVPDNYRRTDIRNSEDQ